MNRNLLIGGYARSVTADSYRDHPLYERSGCARLGPDREFPSAASEIDW